MDALLDELWDVMPCEHPDPDQIIRELLDESKHVLDAKMDEIVDELFASYSQEFIDNCGNGRLVNRTKLKQVVKTHFSSVRYNSLYDWCLKHDILDENRNGHVYQMKKNITALHKRMENMRGVETDERETPPDLEEILIPKPVATTASNFEKLAEVAKLFNCEVEVK